MYGLHPLPAWSCLQAVIVIQTCDVLCSKVKLRAFRTLLLNRIIINIKIRASFDPAPGGCLFVDPFVYQDLSRHRDIDSTECVLKNNIRMLVVAISMDVP